MPVLDWLGKDKVINHHLAAPFHFLDKKFSVGVSDNKIIHGDNLLALKSLLPEYVGKVKCIYIDPPYNTGNENWIYNDAVNDPQIKRWLGQVVGKEGEDLTRHDKWLCMMYPRLRLLQRLLSDDGAIFISIDDNEQASLKFICDEIFGAQNFLADVIWQHSLQVNGYEGKFVSQYNHTLAYSKSEKFSLNNLPRTEEDNKTYKNPDNDPRGSWQRGPCANSLYRPNLKYDVVTPSGKIIPSPEKGWRWSRETLQKKIDSGEVIFNADETAMIHKLYLADLSGKVPGNIWANGIVGTTRSATADLKSIFGTKFSVFDTPKPKQLIERILQLATDKDSLILDSFAGSGTTAHAVINLNASDGGNRRFILIELMDYAESITAERVKRVGGSFDFYELGEPLFDDDGLVNKKIPREQLFDYICYSETGKHYTATDEEFLLAVDDGIAYYYFPDSELNYDLLATIRTRAEGYVIYADNCTLSENFLDAHRITFKKIPSDIRRY